MKKALLSLSLMLAFAAQIYLGSVTLHMRPYWDILDPPPSAIALKANAFGDNQFLYRVLVSELQTGGDVAGRVVALKEYDIDRVIAWLTALDQLDPDAGHHLALAMRLYSLSQRISDLRPLIAYTQRSVDLSPEHKMQWLSSALMLAQVRLKDQDLAVKVADQISSYDFPAMNAVAYQIGPLMRAKAGDYNSALVGMRQALLRSRNKADEIQIKFMEDFIAEMEKLTKSDLSP